MTKRLAMTVAIASTVLMPAATQVHAALTVNDIGLNYAANSTFGGTRDFREVISGVINVAMGFLGIIATAMILYGGFKWMTAGGSPEGVEEAKKIIYAGIIGVVIIILAYAIANFAIKQIIKAS